MQFLTLILQNHMHGNFFNFKSPLNKTTSNSIGLCQRVLIILNQVLFIVGHGDGANGGRFKSPRVHSNITNINDIGTTFLPKG
jgi:hypothetical protein